MPIRNRTSRQLRHFRHLRHLTIGAVLVAGSLAAHAANLGFLNDTPISYMKQRDIDSLRAAAFKALDNQQDNESVTWNNAGTGNGVKMDAQLTPIDTAKDGANTCRTVRVVLNAKGQSVNLGPRFCRQGSSGRWIMQKKN
jgi:surface antigen